MYASWSFLIWMIFLSFIPVHAKTCPPDNNPIEIFLELNVENLILFDLDGYLCNKTLYLPASELFSRLNISHSFSNDRSTLEVDFTGDDRIYRFDFSKLSVQTPQKTIRFEDTDLLYPDESSKVFIRKDLIEEIFLFQIHYDDNRLMLSLFSEYDLPVINDHNRRIRYNDFDATGHDLDSVIEYSAKRSILNGWVFDWNLNSSLSFDRQNLTYGVTTGGHIMGGDLFFSSRGTTSDGIKIGNLRGQWRYPIYSTPVLRQIIAGNQTHRNIFSDGVLQFSGVTITNMPNAPRQFFHDFRISDQIQDGWDVEMYSNNTLTGLARGHLTDKYSFSEPLKYGVNKFTLRHYAPNGFSHEKTYFMMVPHTFLPPGSFEYSLSAGINSIESDEFINAQVNMGISSYLTVGGGYYISKQSMSGYNQSPYLSTSLRVAKRLILEGSHTFGYISEGSLRYLFNNGRSISARGQKFYGTSRYNRTDRIFAGSVNTSFPLNLGLFKLSTFINARGTIYSQYQDININVGFTASLPLGYLIQLRSANMVRIFNEGEYTHGRSDISLTASKRILRKILIRPAINFNHQSGKVSGYGFEANSRISRNGEFSLSAHHDQIIGQYQFQFSFKYNFPFGRYQSDVRSTNSGNISMNQTASGSLVLDSDKGDFQSFNRYQTRTASIRLEPYLILDGKNDTEHVDHIANQLKVTLYINDEKQPTYMEGDIIRNLIPYQEYRVHIEADNLNNPLWRLASQQFQIQVIPHVMNRLPIPIIAVGEVSGRILLKGENLGTPMRNLSVKIEEVDGPFSITVNTYSGGLFHYVGLMPGNYTVTLDPEELSVHNFNIIQEIIFFTIESTPKGDIVDQLLLTIVSNVNEIEQTELFMIQVGAFSDERNATALIRKMDIGASYKVEIVYDPEDQFYKSVIGYFNSKEEAEKFLVEQIRIENALFQSALIIRLKM